MKIARYIAQVIANLKKRLTAPKKHRTVIDTIHDYTRDPSKAASLRATEAEMDAEEVAAPTSLWRCEECGGIKGKCADHSCSHHVCDKLCPYFPCRHPEDAAPIAGARSTEQVIATLRDRLYCPLTWSHMREAADRLEQLHAETRALEQENRELDMGGQSVTDTWYRDKTRLENENASLRAKIDRARKLPRSSAGMVGATTLVVDSRDLDAALADS